MAWVYILKGSKGRYYIGSTTDLQRRLQEHFSGRVYSTKRMGELTIVTSKLFPSKTHAQSMERTLKAWKNPSKAIIYLTQL